MNYSHEVERMCPVTKGPHHGPAPIPEEGKWVKSYQISDISGLSHGVGWCAPQQGTCKLTLNVKDGIVQEALVETLGCSGMTHSAAMAAEILPGKTLLECLNTDLVCDAINVAMREIFKQLAYGRSQTAFSEGGLPIGASLEDLGKGLRSQIGTMFGTKAKGARYLEMAEGYVTQLALNADNEIIGFTDFDREREAAFVITDAGASIEHPEIHAVGRLTKAPDSDTAEFGIVVEDKFQRSGFGAILMQQLENAARNRGARRLSGWVLKGNDAMAGLMSRRGYRAADCPQDATMLIYSLELGQNR